MFSHSPTNLCHEPPRRSSSQQIYCAKDSTCVDATSGASDGTCMTFCDSLSRLHTPATGDPYCAMPCELSLGGSSGGGGGFKLLAYQPIFYSLYSMYSPKQKSVAVDTTQTISCGFGYTAIGSPATADFTCPATRQEETYTKPKLAALGVTLPMCVRMSSPCRVSTCSRSCRSYVGCVRSTRVLSDCQPGERVLPLGGEDTFGARDKVLTGRGGGGGVS